MASSLPANTSQTARLMVRAPGFAVGWQERVSVPSPAPGALWSFKVDGRYSERLIVARFTFTTSAVAGNREVRLALTDNDGAVVMQSRAGQTVPASTALIVNLGVNAADYGGYSSGYSFGYLVDVLAPPDWSYVAQVDGMDAGDAFSGISLLLQRFPNDATSVSVDQ